MNDDDVRKSASDDDLIDDAKSAKMTGVAIEFAVKLVRRGERRVSVIDIGDRIVAIVKIPIFALSLLLAGCGEPVTNTDDLAAPADLASAVDQSVDMRIDMWRPLDGGIREDGGRCPAYPRCMTAADCCNNAPSCLGLAGSPDGYGWCGAKSYEPCNNDPSAGPIVYCYGGGICSQTDHLCR